MVMANDRRRLVTLRDAVLVAVVAIVVVQILRNTVGDRYMVPSDSMQPVLFGDETRGDIVFVDKTASAADCRRHDLVVVKHPEKPESQLVKRIAASGDDVDACWIDLKQGDVWLGPDSLRLVREVKDPIDARSMQVPWANAPGLGADRIDLTSGAKDGAGWRLAPFCDNAADARSGFRDAARRERRRALHPVPSGCIGTTKSVDAGFVDLNGSRNTGHDFGVDDCSMSLEIDAPVELVCTIDAVAHALTFHADLANGTVELWCNGADVARRDARFAVSGPQRIEFGFLDDRAYFVVGDHRESLFVVARDAAWPADRDAMPVGPRTWLYAGVLGTVAAHVRSIAVTRDVYSYREKIAGLPDQPGQWPRFVSAGEWFLLGDNAFDSRDSRHFGPVRQRDFIGRPRFVLGPWPRCRWLGT